jgi:hypothetical protein
MSTIIPEDLVCFRLATLQEMQSLTLNKRYHLVDYVPERQEADLSVFEEKVCIVPEQFPFIFKLPKRQFEQHFSARELHAVLKQLNTMRRIQLVRSSISLKIISQNMRLQNGVRLGAGSLVITFLDLLTSSTLRATKHSFDLQEIDDCSVANIDLETQTQMNATAQVGVSKKCNLVQFELSFGSFCKTQKCILFYGDFKKIRKSDLFYCFLNLRADITLKLYFLASSPGTGGRPVDYSLAKIQIVSSSLGLKKSSSAFNSSLRRSSMLNQNIHNYRFNVTAASTWSKQLERSPVEAIIFSKHSDSLRTINFSGSQTEKHATTDRSETQDHHSLATMRHQGIEDSDSRRGVQPSESSIKGIKKNPTQSGSDVRRVGGRMSVSPPEVGSRQPFGGRDCQALFDPEGNSCQARSTNKAIWAQRKTIGHYFIERNLHTAATAFEFQAQEPIRPGQGGKRIIHFLERVCRRE